MNITYAVPEGKKNYHQFLIDELSEAENIKDKNTRKQVKKGLRRIRNVVTDGQVHLYNGEKDELWTEDYPLDEFIYHCGKKFKIPDITLDNEYLMIVLDRNNCTIGRLVGKEIEVITNEESNVPGKSNPGGFSQQRYERKREENLKQWFREIGKKVKQIFQ